MRVRGADPENRQFVQWLQDLSYVPELNGWIEPPAAVARSSSADELYEHVYL